MSNPYTDMDLEDLHTRWKAALDRGDMQGALVAFEAIRDYLHARDVPTVQGMKDGLLYRITKEEPL